MEDLSHVIPSDPVTALVPTSQAGGNMTSSSKMAMTAPGSPPVDPVPGASEQGDPAVRPSNSTRIEPGDDGHPQPKAGYSPGRPAWART